MDFWWSVDTRLGMYFLELRHMYMGQECTNLTVQTSNFRSPIRTRSNIKVHHLSHNIKWYRIRK